MATEIPIVMPKMSMTMETGELLTWVVAEGAEVRAGDVVAEVQTDKVDMEVETPADGTVLRLVAQPGDTIAVGQPLAFLATEAGALLDGLLGDDPPPDPTPTTTPVLAGPSDGQPSATPPSRRGPLPAVPRARRRAAQLGVHLSAVAPSGPGGVITVADVEAAAEHRAAAVATAPAARESGPTLRPVPSDPPPVATPVPVPTPRESSATRVDAIDPAFDTALAARRRSVRSAVARTLSVSATIPQFTVFADLDLEVAQARRGSIGWTTLLVRALARALAGNAGVLAGWDEAAGAVGQAPEHCAVSIAVDTPIGLLAPVVKDADRLPISELDAAVRDVVARARAARLTGADLHGGHTTLSNLGGFAVPSFTSLLTPPQASALSVGAISHRPTVVGGGLAARLGATVGLTVDHRSVDGADAARVVQSLTRQFAHPDELLD